MRKPIIWCAMFCSGIGVAHADIIDVLDANVLTISNRTTHVRALPKTQDATYPASIGSPMF